MVVRILEHVVYPLPDGGLYRRCEQASNCTFRNVPERRCDLPHDYRIWSASELRLKSRNLDFSSLLLASIKLQFVYVCGQFCNELGEVSELNPDSCRLAEVRTVLSNIANISVKHVLHKRSQLLFWYRVAVESCLSGLWIFSFNLQYQIQNAILHSTNKLLEFADRDLLPSTNSSCPDTSRR